MSVSSFYGHRGHPKFPLNIQPCAILKQTDPPIIIPFNY